MGRITRVSPPKEPCMLKRAAVLTSAVLLIASAGWAQDAAQPSTPAPAAKAKEGATKKLSVGDKAPPLSIEKWVKGEPITGFEKGRVYVIEFWATWCGPCIMQMPHLTSLQKEHKKDGVTIIGVSRKDRNGNTLELVEEMVKEKGDGMGYTVAWDKGSETFNAYMAAAGQQGIPCSFVVDGNGTIAYIGHPMWLDYPLEGLIKGDWDAASGKEKIAKAQERLMAIYQEVDADPEGAIKKIEAFEKEYPSVAPMVADMKYVLMVQTENPAAGETGRKIVEKAVKDKDAAKLNQIAWQIVDPEGQIKKRDLDLAMLAATKGVELTNEKDAAVLDTLARVHFWKGDIDKAIEWQKKAIARAEGGMKDQLEGVLKEYEAKKK